MDPYRAALRRRRRFRWGDARSRASGPAAPGLRLGRPPAPERRWLQGDGRRDRPRVVQGRRDECIGRNRQAEAMTLDEFRTATKEAAPPAVSPLLRALWHDARGEWDAAHQVAQDVDDADGAWVHAYLHRKEGDVGNASYWYGPREAAGGHRSAGRGMGPHRRASARRQVTPTPTARVLTPPPRTAAVRDIASACGRSPTPRSPDTPGCATGRESRAWSRGSGAAPSRRTPGLRPDRSRTTCRRCRTS